MRATFALTRGESRPFSAPPSLVRGISALQLVQKLLIGEVRQERLREHDLSCRQARCSPRSTTALGDSLDGHARLLQDVVLGNAGELTLISRRPAIATNRSVIGAPLLSARMPGAAS
jgi:hypothetical protein